MGLSQIPPPPFLPSYLSHFVIFIVSPILSILLPFSPNPTFTPYPNVFVTFVSSCMSLILLPFLLILSLPSPVNLLLSSLCITLVWEIKSRLTKGRWCANRYGMSDVEEVYQGDDGNSSIGVNGNGNCNIGNGNSNGNVSRERDIKTWFSPVVRKAIVRKIKEGKSPEIIASTLNVPPELIQRVMYEDMGNKLKDETELLLTYVPDSVDIIADTLKSYWEHDITPNERKQSVDIAVKLLQNVGMLSTDSPAYQVNNFIQNNISADVKILATEWKNRIQELGNVVKSIYGNTNNDIPNTIDNISSPITNTANDDKK